MELRFAHSLEPDGFWEAARQRFQGCSVVQADAAMSSDSEPDVADNIEDAELVVKCRRKTLSLAEATMAYDAYSTVAADDAKASSSGADAQAMQPPTSPTRHPSNNSPFPLAACSPERPGPGRFPVACRIARSVGGTFGLAARCSLCGSDWRTSGASFEGIIGRTTLDIAEHVKNVHGVADWVAHCDEARLQLTWSRRQDLQDAVAGVDSCSSDVADKVRSGGSAVKRMYRRICGKTAEEDAAIRKRRRTTMLGRPMTASLWAAMVKGSPANSPVHASKRAGQQTQGDSIAGSVPLPRISDPSKSSKMLPAMPSKSSPSMGGPPPRSVGSWPGGGASPSSPSDSNAKRWRWGVSFGKTRTSLGDDVVGDDSSRVQTSKLLAVATPPRSSSSSSSFPAMPSMRSESRRSLEADILPEKHWQEFRAWKPEDDDAPLCGQRSLQRKKSWPPSGSPAQASRASFVAMTPPCTSAFASPQGAVLAWSPAPGSPKRDSKAALEASFSPVGRGSRRSLVAEDCPDDFWQGFRAWGHTEH